MTTDRTFMKVDLPAWIEGTIAKREAGEKWNSAWSRTYAEIGGMSVESGKKVCPMVAARTLYELGRIVGHGTVREVPLAHVVREYSKNGAYAIAAIKCLQADSTHNLASLWREVQKRISEETGEEPAASNQGGPTLTYKLWKLGILR